MEQTKELTKVTDFDLMIFLICQGHEIQDFKFEKNRSIVWFDNNQEFKNDMIDFLNGSKKINITKYQASQRRLKTILNQNPNK
jgi:hypothetical protein